MTGLAPARVATLTVLLLALPGCAHYGFSASMRTHITTIAVPILVNETLEYGAEQDVTDAIIQEFTRDGTLRVVGEGDADSILRGSVVVYEDRVFSYDAGGNPRDYKLRAVARLKYEDLTESRAVWEGDVEGWAVYTPGDAQSDITTSDDARKAAFQKLAQDVLAKTVQGW
jgi:hypothetical protein